MFIDYDIFIHISIKINKIRRNRMEFCSLSICRFLGDICMYQVRVNVLLQVKLSIYKINKPMREGKRKKNGLQNIAPRQLKLVCEYVNNIGNVECLRHCIGSSS